ncbi:MAG TPA: hypothetical protein VFO42_01930 [Sphingomicrobium sp.]|nr:hypothetical protein [Sphingomicrobium sp.]
MTKAASDVMQDVLIDAVVEAIEALRASSGGLPNNLLRDIQGIHRNAAYSDLPKALQDSINQSVRAAFNQLLKEGYAVGPKADMQSRPPLDRVPERDRRGAPDRRFVRKAPGRRGPDRPGGAGPGRGPRGGGGGKPKG